MNCEVRQKRGGVFNWAGCGGGSKQNRPKISFYLVLLVLRENVNVLYMEQDAKDHLSEQLCVTYNVKIGSVRIIIISVADP